jgi:hypothetical protein
MLLSLFSAYAALPSRFFRQPKHISIVYIALVVLAGFMATSVNGRVLVANHDGDSISSMDELTGKLSTFIPGGSGGLSSPDSMVLHDAGALQAVLCEIFRCRR